eukprot:CAMPEP_0115639340 /NCGR_PEP_ID=MMETSP0272-20121206/35206_1 /TAXON_ID=71861 /ORGANISM="Scrippsiella trochoidea, Strain CCMP3099" /LENGTH=88 /DNA_ID=CAMNT_0003076517 /DNA_START=1778 /DNA_END=2041 /DNA_ORIENTATION=-
MGDKQVARQPLGMQHQGPTHSTSPRGDGFDELLIHGVNAWANYAISSIESIPLRGNHPAIGDKFLHKDPQLFQVRTRHAPSIRWHPFV